MADFIENHLYENHDDRYIVLNAIYYDYVKKNRSIAENFYIKFKKIKSKKVSKYTKRIFLTDHPNKN